MCRLHSQSSQSAFPGSRRIYLGEGHTPLVQSRRIGPSHGLPNLFFKLESLNPTGSYKDRFAAAAIDDMLLHGKRHCVATSSGNTGSALAAYCAAASLLCEVLVVETAPDEKLKQMAAYGAKLTKIAGFGTDANVTRDVFEWAKTRGSRPDSAIQISAYLYSPFGMKGVQSISHELTDQLPEGLHHVFVPAGGGGLTLAIARGFAELPAQKLPLRPRIHCVQPEGNDTIASALRDGKPHATSAICTSLISGLQVPTILDGNEVIAACRDSGGTGHLVTDEQVWDMQRRLAREEGIFCEPAAAVSVAAAIQSAENHQIPPDHRVCCIITGSGFKDAPSVDRLLAGTKVPLITFNDLVSNNRD